MRIVTRLCVIFIFLCAITCIYAKLSKSVDSIPSKVKSLSNKTKSAHLRLSKHPNVTRSKTKGVGQRLGSHVRSHLKQKPNKPLKKTKIQAALANAAVAEVHVSDTFDDDETLDYVDTEEMSIDLDFQDSETDQLAPIEEMKAPEEEEAASDVREEVMEEEDEQLTAEASRGCRTDPSHLPTVGIHSSSGLPPAWSGRPKQLSILNCPSDSMRYTVTECDFYSLMGCGPGKAIGKVSAEACRINARLYLPHFVAMLEDYDMNCPNRIAALAAVVRLTTHGLEHVAEVHEKKVHKSGRVSAGAARLTHAQISLMCEAIPYVFRQFVLDLRGVCQYAENFADQNNGMEDAKKPQKSVSKHLVCSCALVPGASALLTQPDLFWLTIGWFFAVGANVANPNCNDLRAVADEGWGSLDQWTPWLGQSSRTNGFQLVADCVLPNLTAHYRRKLWSYYRSARHVTDHFRPQGKGFAGPDWQPLKLKRHKANSYYRTGWHPTGESRDRLLELSLVVFAVCVLSFCVVQWAATHGKGPLSADSRDKMRRITRGALHRARTALGHGKTPQSMRVFPVSVRRTARTMSDIISSEESSDEGYVYETVNNSTETDSSVSSSSFSDEYLEAASEGRHNRVRRRHRQEESHFDQ